MGELKTEISRVDYATLTEDESDAEFGVHIRDDEKVEYRYLNSWANRLGLKKLYRTTKAVIQSILGVVRKAFRFFRWLNFIHVSKCILVRSNPGSWRRW